MPHIEATDSAGEIDVAIAVEVLDPGALGFRSANRCNEIRTAGHGGFFACDESARLGTGDCGFDLNRFHGVLFLKLKFLPWCKTF